MNKGGVLGAPHGPNIFPWGVSVSGFSGDRTCSVGVPPTFVGCAAVAIPSGPRVGENPPGGGAVALKDINDKMSRSSRASDATTAIIDIRSAPDCDVGNNQGRNKSDDTALMRRVGVTPEGGRFIPPLHSGEKVTAAGPGNSKDHDLAMDWTRELSEGSPPLVILGEDSPEDVQGGQKKMVAGSVAEWRHRVALLEAAGVSITPPPLIREIGMGLSSRRPPLPRPSRDN